MLAYPGCPGKEAVGWVFVSVSNLLSELSVTQVEGIRQMGNLRKTRWDGYQKSWLHISGMTGSKGQPRFAWKMSIELVCVYRWLV